jgi:hypothetical protein
MIKGWNRNSGGHFRSFHLAVLALAILDKVTISDFPSGTRFFFDKAREKVAHQNPDPAGYGGDIGSYISTRQEIDEAVGRFQRAFERSQRAEQCASRERTADAFDYWRLIFGDYFPVYG